jgi:hypothetical protein
MPRRPRPSADPERVAQLVVIHGDGNQVAVGHGQTVTQTIQGDFSKEEVSELLDQAETALQADTTLTDTERDDALADVASMRAQLGKAIPNRAALRALAAGLPRSPTWQTSSANSSANRPGRDAPCSTTVLTRRAGEGSTPVLEDAPDSAEPRRRPAEPSPSLRPRRPR